MTREEALRDDREGKRRQHGIVDEPECAGGCGVEVAREGDWCSRCWPADEDEGDAREGDRRLNEQRENES